jgi:uncharacterized cupredoxin-like copper-binding protein
MRLLALATAACVVAGPAAAAADRTTKVKVTAGKPTEFSFRLSRRSVPTGKVVFTIVNKGTIAHTFKVCAKPGNGKANACKGKGTKPIPPKKTVKLTVSFGKTGTYEYLCTIPGHAAAGMKGTLKVR